MKINGYMPIEELAGRCATCKYYIPLIKEMYGIKTMMARGVCRRNKWMNYKQRTEKCKKHEGVEV